MTIVILMDDFRTEHWLPAVRNTEAGGPFSVPSPARFRDLRGPEKGGRSTNVYGYNTIGDPLKWPV